MELFAPPVERLIEEFAKLPGIGQKTAQRLAFHVLDLPKEDAERFADAIREAKAKTFTCRRCQNLTDSEICPICSDKTRNQKVICVVAEPRDVIAFERTKEYKGLYHVLHGTLSPMGHVGPDDTEMPQMGAGGEPTEVDKAVAKLIVEEIPNGACLQLGIGGMPNTVGSMIAESDLKDLGVHTEMYVDAFVDISRAGKINGSKKAIDRGRQVFAFGAGTQKLYDFVNDNPECMSAPVSYTNDARTIAQIDNFISINNIVDVDLFGQMNAESAGIKQISGAGGQLDFVLGAYLSKGGKSFICCSSTFKKKDGTLESRIRPTLENGSVVTDARPCAHWFVTEYGKVNLKGLTAWQRAEALISVAHPDFREQLIQEAEKMRIWKRSNKR